MRIGEINTADIVPGFMTKDKTVKGLCAAADIFVRKFENKIKLVNLFENLEMVTIEDLDFMAKAENIPWYDTAYTRKQKENIIRNYEKNCMTLGTKTAVKNVSTEIFGENSIKEWYEYKGTPKHYKVVTEFYGDIEKAARDYDKKIGQVKSFRSILDELLFFQKNSITQNAGMEISVRENITIKEEIWQNIEK